MASDGIRGMKPGDSITNGTKNRLANLQHTSLTTNRWTRGENNAAEYFIFYLLDHHHERASPWRMSREIA
ncbi:MAG TPA: hypothetical protein VKM55_00275 [Candidatus Lokiarchaeia archaeon]|nr:hypothetical protein [Candidatus Lokiarchaeia archaeon]